jgi:hypothetical protein
MKYYAVYDAISGKIIKVVFSNHPPLYEEDPIVVVSKEVRPQTHYIIDGNAVLKGN